MAEHDTPRTEAPPSLKDAAWLKRPETLRVFAALSGGDIETRAVGGAVRDALLERPVLDVDFATTAVPDKVMALARKAGLKAIPTGIAHGTVTVVVDGVAFEVTTLRRDLERHAVGDDRDRAMRYACWDRLQAGLARQRHDFVRHRRGREVDIKHAALQQRVPHGAAHRARLDIAT